MKNKNQTKRQPTYDLQECKRLTNMGKIDIPRRVRMDIEDLSNNVPFQIEQIFLYDFIDSLTEKDFSKSILYSNKDIWFDIYIKKHDFYYANNWGEIIKESLTFYFKYFVQDEELFVQIVSFHPER